MKNVATRHHQCKLQEHRHLVRIAGAWIAIALALPGLGMAGDAAPRITVHALAPEISMAPLSSLRSSLAEQDKDLWASLAARSLAAGDLDHDGAPELVVGCEEQGRGAVVVYRGSRTVSGTSALPFDTETRVHATPGPVELVAVGDFDADGHNDLVVTSTGSSSLVLLAGDGTGGLAEPQLRELPGLVSDMVSGEVNRRDGLTDLVLALDDDAGSSVLVLESPLGAFHADGEVFPFAEPVTGLALGQLDAELTREVVVATGDEVVVLHGRDRRLSQARQRQLEVAPAVLDHVAMPAPVVSLAAANLVGDHRDEVAALSADGTVHLIRRAAKEDGWQRQELATEHAGKLHVALASTRSHAELLVAEPSGMTLLGVVAAPEKGRSALLARIDAEVPPVAILALRLDRDALDDLVVLLEGEPAPLVLRAAAKTVYTVNSSDDNDDTICNSTHCSLREAINAANVSSDFDTINIAVGAAIQPLTPLPAIIHGVRVNGWHGTPKPVRAKLDGDLCSGSPCHGLLVSSNKVTLTGLVIKNFPDDGVRIEGNFNLVTGCRIGTNYTGDTAEPNEGNSITILDGDDNVIGGSIEDDANLICGKDNDNNDYGVRIESSTFAASADNQVLGNRIGTDAAGMTTVGWLHIGIAVIGAVGTDVGGSDAGNLVCGCESSGVALLLGSDPPASSSDSLIAGNTIGLAADGLTPLPNLVGIRVEAMNQVTIGGVTPALGNTISGNNLDGVSITDVDDALLVQGNLVGIAADGATAIGNDYFGVYMVKSSSATIGGSVDGAGNVISGNLANGVLISNSDDPTQGGNWLLRNRIGTDAPATIAVPNAGDGITLTVSSMNHIGSGLPGDGNVISGNAGIGLSLYGAVTNPPTGNEVLGNLIGVAGDAVSPLPNGDDGVSFVGVADSRIGGTAVDERNVIAYNTSDGINLGGNLPRRISIRGNSLHANGALGIDLKDDEVTPNDPGDTDDGPNGLQNYPEITGANPDTGSVSGRLDSTAATTFAVDLFASSACDPSGYGEGEIYLGSTSVTTTAAGIGTFTVSGLAFTTGQYLTATATDPDGNTSELSSCRSTNDIFSDGFESGDLSAWSVAVQ